MECYESLNTLPLWSELVQQLLENVFFFSPERSKQFEKKKKNSEFIPKSLLNSEVMLLLLQVCTDDDKPK